MLVYVIHEQRAQQADSFKVLLEFYHVADVHSDGSGRKSWKCYAPKPLDYSPLVTGPPNPSQAPILPAGKISDEDDNLSLSQNFCRMQH